MSFREPDSYARIALVEKTIETRLLYREGLFPFKSSSCRRRYSAVENVSNPGIRVKSGWFADNKDNFATVRDYFPFKSSSCRMRYSAVEKTGLHSLWTFDRETSEVKVEQVRPVPCTLMWVM